MSMNNVEQLDLKALGGADNITVDDVTGTDLRQPIIDLSASGDHGDAQADRVTLNGTNKADHISVNAIGASVDVTGLQASAHIAGSESTDQLRLTSLGGNDTVDVSDAAAALIDVAVDLGSGQT